MDAAVLLLALLAAAGLILALFRRSGGTRTSDQFLAMHEPVRVETHTQSKTFSLADLPPELQEKGNELAQLSLKGQAGGAGLTHEDEERMLELVRELADQAPESASAPATLGDDAVEHLHIETRTNADVGSTSWQEKA